MKKGFTYAILILSLLGFLTSLYLVNNHYAEGEGACDVSETVSCSLVNSSKYSELFNVPVAVFGSLWFIILAALTWQAQKKKHLLPGLLIWNILGVLFIIYMIIAEILLKALCPFCTVVHVIIIITTILSYLMYKKAKKPKLKLNKYKSWIIVTAIIFVIPLILFNLPQEEADHTELAKCITEKGVNMYGSFRCGVCAKTRGMFGLAFEHINEIECHPQGKNAQTDLCLEKGVEGTPTWILEPNGEEIKRFTGFMNTEELAEFAGCE